MHAVVSRVCKDALPSTLCLASRGLASATHAAAAAGDGPVGPLDLYKQLLVMERLRPDSSQLGVVHWLQRFAQHSEPCGVYLWGSVGCGKSMLMDLLVGSMEGGTRVRRQHFHELMLDVHRQLHALQMARPRTVVQTKQGGLPMYKYGDFVASKEAAGGGGADPRTTEGGDGAGGGRERRTSTPLAHVIDAIASQTSLLCLDEMQVTDVADAMLLRQLFEGLFDGGRPRATAWRVVVYMRALERSGAWQAAPTHRTPPHTSPVLHHAV